MFNKHTKPINYKTDEIRLSKDLKLIYEDSPAHFDSEATILAAYYRFKLGDNPAVMLNAGTFLKQLYDGTYFNPFVVICVWLDMQDREEKYRTKTYEQTRLKYISLFQRYVAPNTDDVEDGDGEQNN